jgi:hypothetical protein
MREIISMSGCTARRSRETTLARRATPRLPWRTALAAVTAVLPPPVKIASTTSTMTMPAMVPMVSPI